MERPEQHFDRVKSTTHQLSLVLADAADVVRGPWIAPCGDPGPYAIRRPTPKAPNRLQVLTCTRPRGHNPLFHQAADGESRVLAQWTADGRPDFPPVIKPRSEDGSDVSV